MMCLHMRSLPLLDSTFLFFYSAVSSVFVICTEEGICIGAETFAFYYKKFPSSVIRYTTTIMDPPSHTGLFALQFVHKKTRYIAHWFAPQQYINRKFEVL